MRFGITDFEPAKIESSASKTASTFIMQKFRLFSGRKSVFGMLVAFGLAALAPLLWAQQDKGAADSPQAAWSSIQQLVNNLETAV